MGGIWRHKDPKARKSNEVKEIVPNKWTPVQFNLVYEYDQTIKRPCDSFYMRQTIQTTSYRSTRSN